EQEPVLAMTREFFSDNVIRLLRDAHHRAVNHSRERITPMDLLISLLTASNSIVAECFERIAVTAANLTELAFMADQQPGSDLFSPRSGLPPRSPNSFFLPPALPVQLLAWLLGLGCAWTPPVESGDGTPEQREVEHEKIIHAVACGPCRTC